MKINKSYFKLLRINHWFKNVIVLFGFFVALYVYGFSTILQLVFLGLGAFFLASVISSVNYIVNQITDSKFDKKHPTKKNRPVPAGEVSVAMSFLISIFLFIACFLISISFFPFPFTVSLVCLWIAGIVYNVEPIRFKDRPYWDVVNESINNPLRFLIGWFAISSVLPNISILLSTWTAGAMLMTAKRYDELSYFGSDLVPYRETFKSYTLTSLKWMMYFYSSSTIFFLSYYFYIKSPRLLVLIPIYTLFLIWTLYQVISGHACSRSVEKFVLSSRFVIPFCITIILSMVVVLA